MRLCAISREHVGEDKKTILQQFHLDFLCKLHVRDELVTFLHFKISSEVSFAGVSVFV